MNDVFLARRHSKRLKNVLVSAHKEDVQCVIDEVILSGSEEPSHQEGGPSTKTLEEKVNYLLRKFQENQKVIEELKFKKTQKPVSCKRQSSEDIGYKKFYIDSYKKVESLKNENCQLALKLEVALAKLEAVESLKEENHKLISKLETALAKLEAHEKNATIISEVLEKAKDVMLVSHLTSATEKAEGMTRNSQVMEKAKDMMTRAAETAKNVSNQEMKDAITPPSTSVQTNLPSTERKKLEDRKKE